MELWWIILAGCGGGLLLFAYVAFIIYKIARHRTRKRQSNPDVLTYDQDWTVHVKELIERREDGLRMDTASGSTKLRRKSMIPGEPEAVLQSVATITTPVTSPRNNNTDKQEGVQDVANDTSYQNQETRKSPKVDQRTEYTWEKLLPLSGGKIKRSRSFHYNLSENRTPIRSLNFGGECEGQRDVIRSKSLRGYKYYASPSSRTFSAQEPLPPTEIVVSVTNGDGQRGRKVLEKRSRGDQSNSNVTEATAGENTTNAYDNNKPISRSRSAPSTRAKEKVVKREAEDRPRGRSESLRWIPEPDYQSVSIEELVQRVEEGNGKDNPESSFERRQPRNTESAKATPAKRANSVQTSKISRSGSAPSTQTKERVVRRKVEEPSRQRSVSVHWIPEPDYHAVSVEDLVSAIQTRVKTSENNVCVVEIHNPPKNCEAKVRKAVDACVIGSGLGEIFTSLGSNQGSGTSHESQQRKTSGNCVNKFPVPGVAQRIPARSSVSNEKSQEQDGTETGNEEKAVSVKNRIQNLEGGILSRRINSVSNQRSPTVSAATVKSDNKSQPKSMLNSNETPPANVGREEPTIDNSPTVLLSPINKQPEVRAIGKMKIVKSDDTPAWLVNQERTLKRPIRETPPVRLERAPSAKTNPLTDQSTKVSVSLIHSKDQLARPSTSELVKAALRNKNKSNTTDDNNNLISVEGGNKPSSPTVPATTSDHVQGSETKVPIPPAKETVKHKETSTTVTENVDTCPSLEEKKRNWKREQIVDQLHTARQRNSNQNYIFGTGLAYQSCMPELQNKLKELTLAK